MTKGLPRRGSPFVMRAGSITCEPARLDRRMFIVNPDARGRGVGRTMLEALMDDAHADAVS